MKLIRRLALDGIRKNKAVYFPYIIIYAFMVLSFNSILLLNDSKAISGFPGMGGISTTLQFSALIIGIFALIFLYYSDSYLLNKRLKEISLYAILGLRKGQLVKILAFEELIISMISIGLGLFSSGLLYKVLEGIFLRIMKMEADFSLSLSPEAFIKTSLLFFLIGLLILITRAIKIKRKPILDLFKEEKTFKRPKGLILSSILALALIGAGYSIALTVDNPIAALKMFFFAVFLVMVGTFFLFSSLSIVILKFMKKSKSYYKAENFISVSSLIFRIRENSKGLASITIMSTAAIILLSSAITLYRNIENTAKAQYPRDVVMTDTDRSKILSLKDLMKEEGISPNNEMDYSMITAGLKKEGSKGIHKKEGNLYLNPDGKDGLVVGFYHEIFDSSLKDISDLKDGEYLLYRKDKNKDLKSIDIDGTVIRKKSDLEDFAYKGLGNAIVLSEGFESYYIITKDLEKIRDRTGDKLVYNYYFDLNDKDMAKLKDLTEDDFLLGYHDDFLKESYKFYGAIFFVGIFMGLIFMLGTGLIIYYKQIQEGQADKDKFMSLRRLGIGEEKIKRTIDKQVKTFFFLPLLVAGIHTAFAFPIIAKLFISLSVIDMAIKISSFVVGYLIFAVFYFIYYRLSSRTYYKLIS